MNKNRFAKSAAVAAGLILMCALPSLAGDQSTPPAASQAKKMVSPAAQPNRDSSPPDDFAGLNFTDDQKAEIEKIHQETEASKAAVAKDQKLTADQKNALLLGYTRMEYGRRYKVLTPEQRREVNQRILARRSADQAAQRKQPPRN